MRLLRISFSLPRFSGLCLFVTAYVGLFAIAGLILFGSLFRIRRSSSIITSDSCKVCQNIVNNVYSEYTTFSLLEILSQRPVEKQENERRYFKSKRNINTFSKSLLDFYWQHSHSSLIDCTSLQEVSETEYVAAGWTKIVYKGTFRGQKVAIKTARHNGRDIEECQKELDVTLSKCFQKVDAKIIKEIILLTELAHENVVKILGFCIPDADGSATLVTELGEPMDTVRLLQISWEDRLRLVLGIARILHHFAHSPVGSLSMNDFRREQFVVVDGILKVTDLDDVGIGDPECISDEMCQNIANIALESNTTGDFATRISPCSNFRCAGHNSRVNIWHAGQHFVKLLLPIGAPDSLQPYIQDLLDAYEFKGKSGRVGDVSHILDVTELLVSHYKTGEYFHSHGGIGKLGFKRVDNGDLPGMFDYRCRYSISMVSCVMSVYNEEEAAQFCAQDIECKAVILSKQQTWTGRTIAIFKNGCAPPVEKEDFTLLLKQGL